MLLIRVNRITTGPIFEYNYSKLNLLKIMLEIGIILAILILIIRKLFKTFLYYKAYKKGGILGAFIAIWFGHKLFNNGK